MNSSPEPPGSIGRFEVRREIGRGAMGIVYEAFDPTLHRRVALKTIALAFGVSESERHDFEERFLDEARAVASLSHPGIVTVHDAGRDEATSALFMALEYLEGRTLADFAAEKAPVDWRDAFPIAASVARALHAAHAMGIIHRDIKPANIMLLASGETKVMDFGIAKLQASYAHLTSTGQMLGTPLYMSPEQALGQPLDGRSDLFSLGVVLYHLLTGVRLFDADSVPRIVTKVAYEEGRPASELVAGLPSGVDQILSRLLAKAPEQRYADGRELAEDTEDLLAEHPLRHAGTAPRTGTGTLVSKAGIAPASPSTAKATRVATPPSAPATIRGSTGFGKLLAVGILVFAAGLFSARAVWQSSDEGGSSRAADDVASEPAKRPAAAPAKRTPRPTPTAAERSGPAQLRVDFQHHYKSGTVTVYVDKKPVFSQSLGGDVRAEVAGVELRRGEVASTLEVQPGRRDIWVEVRWDDNRRSGGLSGTFKAGRARTLRIRIDRFVKKMSLEWR